MSKTILLNQDWIFSKDGHDEAVTLPHTWNAVDGQDGGNDYYRGTCHYTKTLTAPEVPAGGLRIQHRKPDAQRHDTGDHHPENTAQDFAMSDFSLILVLQIKTSVTRNKTWQRYK